MNRNRRFKKRTGPKFARTATVVILSLLLFFLPCMLVLFSSTDEPHEWRMVVTIMAALYAAIFCLNYFWIVPATMIRNNKRTLFFLYNLIAIIAACSVIPLWFEFHGGIPGPHGRYPEHLGIFQHILGYLRLTLRDVITMILSAGLAYALRLSQHQENLRQCELQLEAERHSIELRSLKAQLNPHFLFNAINNIYSLIAVSSDRAQKALYEFSGILRFLIYEASEMYVPLSKELTFIRDYVELMKLRLSPSIKLDCGISDAGTARLSIAPLLLLTMVENAFKHVDRNAEHPFISIHIGVVEDQLVCSINNSCSSFDHPATPETASGSGVGLVNVENQLRLLYPDAYTFDHGCVADIYHAEIRIKVSALMNNRQPDCTPEQLGQRV